MLWLTPDFAAAVGATESDDGGRFALAGPPGEAVLLARLRGPVLGAAHARLTVEPGAEARLDMAGAPAPAFPVEVTVTGDVPEQLTVLLTPAALPGLPDAALPWTYRLGADTNETFAVLAVAARASLTVQAGEWHVAATHAQGARAREVSSERLIWRLAALRVDGGTVPSDLGGGRIRVDRPLAVELAMHREVQR